MRRALLVAGALYAAVALGTFGRSAAGWERFYQANCSTLDQRRAVGERCYQIGEAQAMMAGVLWPLYWSWEAWS